METAGTTLLILGFIIFLIGGIRFRIAEFRESFWWLLAGLLLPITDIVFLCVHFNEAWPSTKICLVGFLIILAGALLPEIRTLNL